MTKRKERDENHRSPASDAPISSDFWTSPTLDELAKAQNVGPLDVSAIFGKWPGDADDGFEADIDELRHPGRLGERRPKVVRK